MFGFSDGVVMKTAHNPCSDAQKETTSGNAPGCSMMKRPRIDGSCEMAVEEAMNKFTENNTRKNAIIKEQDEKIQTLKTANENQKKEINHLNSKIKATESLLQNEINQRESVSNKVGVTREMREKLEEHTSELRNILQKSVYDRQRVAECYKNATDMIEQLKNDAQKYQSELNKVQKQLESEQQLHLELNNIWKDKNNKIDEYNTSLKEQISSLQEANKSLKLKEDESAIREKQYKEEILNLTMLKKQSEHAHSTMKSDFKSIYEKFSQENKDLSKSLIENKTRISQLEDELEESKVTLKKQDAKSKVFQEEILDLNEQIEALKKEVEDKSFFEQKVANLQMLKDSLENQNSTLTNDKTKLDEQISYFKQELEENKIFIQENCNVNYVLQEKVKDLEDQLKTLKNEKENIITSLGTEFDEKLKVISWSHDGEIKKYEKSISNLQEDLEMKSRKIIELITEAERISTKLEECESNLENTTSKLKFSNEEVRILHDYTKDNNTEIEELKEKLADTENMHASMVDELKVLKEKFANDYTKNLNRNTDNVLYLSNILHTKRENALTIGNSPMLAENKINGVKSSIKWGNSPSELSYYGGNNISLTQPGSLKKDKKKKSTTQKEKVTSTNEATPKKPSKFSKVNGLSLGPY